MRRLSVILLLLFQAVFLNIVVPGHLRGVVTRSGKTSIRQLGDLACGGCCKRLPADNGKNAPHERKSEPTPQDRKDCAICYVAALLNVPSAIVIELPPLEQIELLPDSVPQIVEASSYVHTYDACGPPDQA